MERKKLNNHSVINHCHKFTFKFMAVVSFIMFCCTSCSLVFIAPKNNTIPLDPDYTTLNATLAVSSHYDFDGGYTKNFLNVKQTQYDFYGQNSSISVLVFLNRGVELRTPELGEWNTVSTGNCLYESKNATCYTAHVDCHLVRTTIIQTGPKSVVVIRNRINAREPERLCDAWQPSRLTESQQDEVDEFNRISDKSITFSINKTVQQKK